MRRTLFRYRSFNTDKLNDYSYIHQRIINIEKWKFEAFEGLVYPSSPLYFNDPYDCEFCFQSDALEGVLDRETYIHLLERRFSLKQEEKNRILYSAKTKKAETIAQLEIAKEEIKKPFVFEDELKEKTERLNALNIELNLNEKDTSVMDTESEQAEEQPERKCASRER